MALRVHYEILRDAGSGWTLAGAYDDKALAEAEARAIMGQGRSVAVRVVRSSFNPALGTFNDSEVLFLGERAKASRSARDRVPVFPCWKPDDFYELHGRLGIQRALKDVLERWALTPVEMLHNAEHCLRLNDTETVLQAAVQRAAITQTQGTGKTAQQRMRELYDLITQTTAPLYAEDKKRRHPRIQGQDHAGFLKAIDAAKQWRFQFFVGFADHLQTVQDWPPKIACALALLDASGEDARVIEALDSFFAEMALLTKGLTSILGAVEHDGEKLRRLTRVLKGEASDWADAPPVFDRLSPLVGAGRMPELKRAIGQQIMDGVLQGRPLTQGDLLTEARAVGALYRALMQEGGALFGGEPMEEAFTKRCEGFSQAWRLTEMLDGIDDPREQLARLLDLAAEVVGAANRRRIGEIAMQVLENPANETRFLPSEGSPLDALAALARLQRRAMTGGFSEMPRQKTGEALDRLQYGQIQRLNLFARLESGGGDAIDHARRLLDLIDKGMFTRGQSVTAAKARLTELLRAQGFLERFVARLPAEQRIESLLQFRTQLQKHGIRAVGL